MGLAAREQGRTDSGTKARKTRVSDSLLISSG